MNSLTRLFAKSAAISGFFDSYRISSTRVSRATRTVRSAFAWRINSSFVRILGEPDNPSIRRTPRRRAGLLSCRLQRIDHALEQSFALEHHDLRLEIRRPCWEVHASDGGINGVETQEIVIDILNLERRSGTVARCLRQADQDRSDQPGQRKDQQRLPVGEQNVPIVQEAFMSGTDVCPTRLDARQRGELFCSISERCARSRLHCRRQMTRPVNRPDPV